MNFFDYLFEKSKDSGSDLVVGNVEQISYKEVYKRSISLAYYLKKNGIASPMLIIAPNSVFFITVYLGILKSGNVCVPLNTEIEKENLDYIISQSVPEIIFIPEKFRKIVDEYDSDIRIITEVDLTNVMVNIENSTDSEENFDDNSLAEIIFTSGSTGKPKGVMISHKNLIANTSSILAYLQLTESDRMLVVLPFYYCYGLSLLHTHIRVGGSVVLNNSFIFLGKVISDLNIYKCTGFAGVPSHYQILLRKSTDFKNTKFPFLKYVTQAGGKLHSSLINEFVEAFPEIKFFVMYGQTEATARLSYLPPELLKEKIGSLGKGIPGVVLRVVDELGIDVKEGEAGEIIAKGENIMLGYYNDKESTDKTLINGYLHTGDVAEVDKDGFIFMKGRKKEFIKIHGMRISPKEIEEVILENPMVLSCTVKETYDDIFGETIKAEVLVNSKEGITATSIQEYCSGKLASYKIPRIIELKTNFELNASGKKITT